MFAVNLWNPGDDFNDGVTLACTLHSSKGCLVILDDYLTPLRRLWCLYEIAVAVPVRMHPRTHRNCLALGGVTLSVNAHTCTNKCLESKPLAMRRNSFCGIEDARASTPLLSRLVSMSLQRAGGLGVARFIL